MAKENQKMFDVKDAYFRQKYPLEVIYGSPSRFNPCLIYVYEEIEKQTNILERIEQLLTKALQPIGEDESK